VDAGVVHRRGSDEPLFFCLLDAVEDDHIEPAYEGVVELEVEYLVGRLQVFVREDIQNLPIGNMERHLDHTSGEVNLPIVPVHVGRVHSLELERYPKNLHLAKLNPI